LTAPRTHLARPLDTTKGGNTTLVVKA